MKSEFEVKILDINVDEAKKRLESAGAVFYLERFMRRYVYDISPDKPDTWIRLRDNGEKITITLKDVRDESIGGTKEIEITVNNFERAHALLKSIGLKEKAYQENKRISYRLGDVKIEIDTWPMIPAYLEVEGKSIKDIENAVKLLGYTMPQTTPIRVLKIYEKYGIDIHKFKELKF